MYNDGVEGPKRLDKAVKGKVICVKSGENKEFAKLEWNFGRKYILNLLH